MTGHKVSVRVYSQALRHSTLQVSLHRINLLSEPQNDDIINSDIRCHQSSFLIIGLTVAASWDTAVMKAWGAAMGSEFKGKGANVQLGPGLCTARLPQNGRNFEYLSGEKLAIP